jgi:NAD(P)-dependent dehydrogenase (short-subunit alcohol dehydrogenase family)
MNEANQPAGAPRSAYDFSDRVVLLTGAARGIGLACATLFHAAGARVVLADVDEAGVQRAAAELGERASGLPVDVADPGSARAMVARTIETLGRVDVFVNNAARFDDKTFIDSTPADWARIMDTNLFATMHCLHAVLPHMVGRGYGRIVCLSSDSARIGQARLSYYAAAKAGVIALVKSIAQEIGDAGVTLNVVSPGATDTPQRRSREEALRAAIGDERYRRREAAVLKRYPLGRLGEPLDTAHAVAYFASDAASWVTGQTLSVNGGFTMA